MKIFVYGSLRKGQWNHRLLERSRFLGQTRTEARFRLHDMGHYPGMTKGRQAVTGELYDVDETTLADLDRLEGHPRFYRRTEIRLEDGSSVETYLLPASRLARKPVVDSGDWLAYYRERTER